MISERERVDFLYRAYIRDYLIEKLDGRFWIGPDVQIAQDTTFSPEYMNIVPVTFPVVSPFENLPPQAFHYVSASTRSRYAQLGLEVSPNAGVSISETPSHDVSGLCQTEIFVKNLSCRPIFLPKGARLFRLYFSDSTQFITGRGLVDTVRSGKIGIDGIEGKDWRWSYSLDWRRPNQNIGNQNSIDGIEFVINPESRRFLPPDPENQPVTIPDNTGGNYREMIDRLLEPIPESEEPILWIGETQAKLKLDPSIHGLLNKAVTTKDTPGGAFEYSWQTNSALIEGGRTNWPIRTEIYSPTKGVIPEVVFMRFALADRKAG